jgi:hypothetical protein
MILFGWTRGGFPRYELIFGIMAKALYEDGKNEWLPRLSKNV